MKPNPLHEEILALIKQNSGVPTQHTFLDSYLGNEHPRYPINAPTMRKIARNWMGAHRELKAKDFQNTLTSLIHGKSSTEKCMAGVLLDTSTSAQKKFDPNIFDTWLDHLEGWAEVDSVCTGPYTITEIQAQWSAWKKLLVQFSKSKNINKRRASLVLLCSPLRKAKNELLVSLAFQIIDRLKPEKSILITKAISWNLRSAVPHYATLVKKYLALNKNSLPRIALRETLTKLKTGKKTKSKISKK